MTNPVRDVIAIARRRGGSRRGTCLVCGGRVSTGQPSVRMHAGVSHARCAAYSPRRSR